MRYAKLLAHLIFIAMLLVSVFYGLNVLAAGIIAFFYLNLNMPLKGNKPFSVRTFGVTTTFLFVGVVLLNYFVNPLGLYSPRLIEPIRFPSREEKVRLYQAMNPSPEAIIFGSSRSFTLSPTELERLTGYRAFNASFFAGYPYDFLGFTYMISENSPIPSLVVIGLAVEQFSEEVENILEPHNPFPEYLPRTSSRGYTTQMLLSRQQTEASFNIIKLELTGRGIPHFYFDPDGWGHFNSDWDLEEAVAHYLINGWGAELFAFEQLNPIAMQNLEQLLAFYTQASTEIVIYFPPYHPIAQKIYDEQSHYPELKRQLMTQLAGWQAEYPFHLYDFAGHPYFDTPTGLFYDAVHPSEEAGNWMLQQMLAQGLG